MLFVYKIVRLYPILHIQNKQSIIITIGSDQLFKIFQRRGTPTAETWPAVMRLPHFNTEFPQWREHPMTDFVTLESLGGPAGADLLAKLLMYDPDRRIACKTALQHPFFLQE
jgi:cyclin-dependent kinase 2